MQGFESAKDDKLRMHTSGVQMYVEIPLLESRFNENQAALMQGRKQTNRCGATKTSSNLSC